MRSKFRIIAVFVALIMSMTIFVFVGCEDKSYTELVFETKLKTHENELSLKYTARRLRSLFSNQGYKSVAVSYNESLITLKVSETSEVDSVITFMSLPICVSFNSEDSEQLSLTDDIIKAVVYMENGEYVVGLTLTVSGLDKLYSLNHNVKTNLVVTNGGNSYTVASAKVMDFGTHLILNSNLTYMQAITIAHNITNNILGYTFELVSQKTIKG